MTYQNAIEIIRTLVLGGGPIGSEIEALQTILNGPFSARESCTLLAALRCFQKIADADMEPVVFQPGFIEELEHFEDADPLKSEEIDELCDRINVAWPDIGKHRPPSDKEIATAIVDKAMKPKYSPLKHMLGLFIKHAEALNAAGTDLSSIFKVLVPSMFKVLQMTDWTLLRDQKRWLIGEMECARDREDADAIAGLEGIIALIDAIQDAAHADGFPVEFL